MARRQGTSYDRCISSSRWRKTQTRRQAYNSGTMDLARSEGWKHRRAPDRKSKEKKRTIDIDQPNVNYKNTTTEPEDLQCLDSSLTAGTTWKR